MRMRHVIICGGLLGFAAASWATGCTYYVDDYYTPLTKLPDGGTSTTSSSSSSGGTGGDDGGPPPGCIPSENVDAVSDTCGVFVSSSQGDDGNAGSKATPLKTIGAALALAKGKPVYVCGESFAESVSVSADATLYGGLDCANGWVYDAAKKTQVNASADAVALTISKATTNVQVFDFAITSATAAKDGGSSIAVLVAQAAASFTRCDVVAGDGKAGAPGAAFASAAQAGSTGNKGNDACSASFVVPGLEVTNACSDGQSISGQGGNGSTNSGGPGGAGSPGAAMNGGVGQDLNNPVCTDGTKGDDGAAGNPGLGATGLGTIAANGYTGVSGGEGTPGHVAQGGGGGGGSKGETTASVCPMGKGGGASGGSGGSGGCGGQGGKGGAFGGASLALVSIDATLSFTSVTLKAGNGGNGGDGGNGQSGGDGGTPGPGGTGSGALKPGCAGGVGGKGGSGGKGGGGTGGHSIAIAFTGKAPPMSGWTATQGKPGSGGVGDNANGNAGGGQGGLACTSLDFANPTSCTK